MGYSPWGCKESGTTEETLHSPTASCLLSLEPEGMGIGYWALTALWHSYPKHSPAGFLS